MNEISEVCPRFRSQLKLIARPTFGEIIKLFFQSPTHFPSSCRPGESANPAVVRLGVGAAPRHRRRPHAALPPWLAASTQCLRCEAC